MKLDTSKTSWDFSSLIEEDWQKVFDQKVKLQKEKVNEFADKWKDQSKYLEDENVLLEALDDYEELRKEFGMSGKVGFFIWLKKMQDQNDEEIKAKYNIIDALERENINQVQFFEIGLSKISLEKQKEFLSSEKLAKYHNFLKKKFRAGKYLLSESEEKTINLLDKTSYQNWVDMLSEHFSNQERVVNGEIKNFSEIISMVNDPDKKTRDSAAEAFNDILEKHSDTAVSQINSLLEYKKTIDKIRGFSRPDESRLVSDDIDENFVDSLIEAVTSNFDIAQEFYELKAKLFKVKKLAYHERNLIYGNIDKKFKYTESSEWIYDIFSRLDKEFGEAVKKMIEQSYIDVFPRKGKRQGAFCTEGLKSNPVYVLLNFAEKFDDVKTMAHELGHATNGEMMKKQNSLNYSLSMGVAEVASNFFEEVLYEEVLKNTKNDEEKLSFLMMHLNESVSSVFRQIACYRFEKEIHEEFRKKGNISKQAIGEIFLKNMSAYMGDFVEYPEESKNWWVYWSHIRDYFYVYSYSSGSLIANAMKHKLDKDKRFIEKIKEFYSAGSSKSPTETFKQMGIEINEGFWNEGIIQIKNQLNEAKILAKKLGKI